MNVAIAVLVLLFVVFVGLCVAASRQPDEFRVTRSTGISASPASVFAKVNDFRSWSGWSPWAALDTSMKTSYSGPSKGVGASFAWSGNAKVGQGSMRIVESVPGSRIGIQLEFIRPFRATNRTTFTLTPLSNGTRVTWTMVGKNRFRSKLMSLFVDLDKQIGETFERGLSNLKTNAEHGPESGRSTLAPDGLQSSAVQPKGPLSASRLRMSAN